MALTEENYLSPRREVSGDFASNPRIMAHDTFDLYDVAAGALITTQIPNTGNPKRGASLFVGKDITQMTVTMESGEEAVFRGVAAGSFMPILVLQVKSVSPALGNKGELVALL
jgi:hypothetical protein